MGFKKVFLAMAVLLAFTAGVFAQSVEFTIETKNISLAPGQGAPVLLNFYNGVKSLGAANVAVKATASSSAIIADLPETSFALNPGERTSVTLFIKATSGAAFADYNVLVESNFSGADAQPMAANISVNVSGGNHILFLPQASAKEICLGGYLSEFEIGVKNQSATAQSLQVYSELGIFFPKFGQPEFSLAAGEEKTIGMKINFNGYTQAGNYTLPLYAKTGGGNIYAGKVSFNIVECGAGKPFGFFVGTKNISMQKLSTRKVFFTLSNNLGGPQDMFFSAVGDLHVTESQTSFTLNANSSQQGSIEIVAGEFDRPGIHLIDLFAWSKSGKEKQTIAVGVGKMHGITATLLSNGFETQSCSAAKIAVFSVEFQNNGDTKETITLSVKNTDRTIGATVLEPKFDLLPQEKKTVNIAVSPGFDTEIGPKEIFLHVVSTGIGLLDDILLQFNVTAPENAVPLPLIKIASAPAEISATAGEEKTISMRIKNTGATVATGLAARVRGTDGSQFLFRTGNIPSIGPNESALVNFGLKALESARTTNYGLTIEIVSGNAVVATAPFLLAISRPQNGIAGISGQNNEFLGIMGFWGMVSGQMGVLPVILIVAVGMALHLNWHLHLNY